MSNPSVLFRRDRILALGLVGLLAVSLVGGASFSRPGVVSAADDSILINTSVLTIVSDEDDNFLINVGDQMQVSVTLDNADGGCEAAETVVRADLTAYGGSDTALVPCVGDNDGISD